MTLLHLVSEQTMQNLLPLLALKPETVVQVRSRDDRFHQAAENLKRAVVSLQKTPFYHDLAPEFFEVVILGIDRHQLGLVFVSCKLSDEFLSKPLEHVFATRQRALEFGGTFAQTIFCIREFRDPNKRRIISDACRVVRACLMEGEPDFTIAARTGFLRRKIKGLAVTLVYSATAGKESQLTARLIGNFLKQRGVEVAEIKLKDVGVPANPQANPAEAARLAEAGLIRLYDKLEAHVRKLRQLHPDLELALNATGGYKAETAILYGLGCALGLPVYYRHETYRVAITLPVCAVPF